MHISKLLSLEGKTAVVIGGAGKIGFSIAEALGEAGALVYVASANEDSYEKAVKKLSKSGLKARGIQLDMSDEKSVLLALKLIKKDSKIPDILINSGCIRPMRKFMEDSVENWDLSMSVNARGIFVTCRLFANSMAEQGSGSIINISSIYGLVAPDMNIYEGSDFETEPDYPFIKGGVIMFSKYLASYYAKKGIRVNCIAPGGFFNNQPEPFLTNYIKKVPLKRMACHDDIKGAALFLSSKASEYITGHVLTIDGGFTVV